LIASTRWLILPSEPVAEHDERVLAVLEALQAVGQVVVVDGADLVLRRPLGDQERARLGVARDRLAELLQQGTKAGRISFYLVATLGRGVDPTMPQLLRAGFACDPACRA
jgi:hypothetical protein